MKELINRLRVARSWMAPIVGKGLAERDVVAIDDAITAIESLQGDKAELVHQHNALMDHCQSLQEAISALEAMRWVKCSERLPDAMGYILVADKDGFVTEADYMPDTESFFSDDGHHIDDATHWMPLPAPPKVEQEEV